MCTANSLKDILSASIVHENLGPEIDDSFSPDAIDMVGMHRLHDRLSCAYTWNSRIRVYNDDELDFLVDRLPLSVSTWHKTIQLCTIAASYHVKGYYKKSKSFLTQCFIPLLEIPGIQTKCPLTNKHREALKHFIDSTSTFIQLSECDGHEARRNVYDYAKSIRHPDSMDKTQRAALYAIRSQLADYPDSLFWARAAVKLNPEEGQWHYYLAETLFEAVHSDEFSGKARQEAMEQVLKHNNMCLKLRPDAPEPYLLMAELRVASGDSGSEKSYVLVQNALKAFPNNTYVNVRAADILQSSVATMIYSPQSYSMIEPLYQKAIRLAGKECACLRYKLGLFQLLLAKFRLENFEETYDEGIRNLEIAALSIPDARIHLEMAKTGSLDPSAVGTPHMTTLNKDDSAEDGCCGRCCKSSDGSEKKEKKGKGRRK